MRDSSRLCLFSELVSGVNSARERLYTASITGAINYQKLLFRMDNPEAYEEVPVLELAIAYDLMKSYPSDLDKDQKRAMGKRARSISVENGEVYLVKKKR